MTTATDPSELVVNDMGPLWHIYVGPKPVAGSIALCGHRCPDTAREAEPYDGIGRYCVTCKRLLEERRSPKAAV